MRLTQLRDLKNFANVKHQTNLNWSTEALKSNRKDPTLKRLAVF